MTAIRTPSVAGSFYPDQPGELARVIDEAVASAAGHDVDPVALVAPHAGYRWSGHVAAAAHGALARRTRPIERVVVAGPAHKVSVPGIGLPSASLFATPIGDLPVDSDAVASLSGLTGVGVADRSHRREYSVEVQLPFVRHLIGAVPIVPLVVGAKAPPWLVTDVLERLWSDDGTAVVISSDLSHHQPIDGARQTDAETTRRVERLDVTGIDSSRMCGAAAVRGLLKIARRRHLDVTALDVRNSGDFGADPNRVVGYGAYAVTTTDRRTLTAEARQELFDVARNAARARVDGRTPDELDPESRSPELSARSGAFVSVTVDGKLRGCLGSTDAAAPLADTVASLAASAVGEDPRFRPVGADEVSGLELDVYVLSPLARVFAGSAEELADELVPGEHGVVLCDKGRQATFLPSVWENMSSKAEFIDALLAKGSLAPEWSPDRAAYTYTVQSLG